MIPEAALAALRAALGADAVITDPDRLAPWLVDERRLFSGRALAAVEPQSTAEVSAIVEICREQHVPMVPQGGNTSYCGAATPDASGRALLIRFPRLSRLRAVDALAGTLTVEAGMPLAAVQAAARDAGWFFPLSMGSEATAQLGGALSTNAGGLTVVRYGTARELVLGLEVVLPDGQVLSQLQALRKDNTGYDLRHLFMGAEGTLGIITAAVLRLFPEPAARETLLLNVRDAEAACACLNRARRTLGDTVESCEFFTREALALVLAHEAGARDPFAGEAPALLLLEIAGTFDAARMRDTLGELAANLLDEALAADVLIAESPTQRAAWWRLRERIPAAERAEGGSVKHDVSVPLGRIPELAALAVAGVRDRVPHIRCSVYGHMGDGNLHLNFLAPVGAVPEDFRATHGQALSADVHALAVRLGGSFSAEHGVGQLKRELLRATRSPVALGLMMRLKQAFDPDNLMNPGKVL
jgi:D-lactate dehydrogenase (cytochrome)